MKEKERKAQQAYIEAARKSPALAIGMALMQGMEPPKKAKRRPLLLDEVLANKHKGVPKSEQKKIQVVQDRLRSAKVFVLDEAAAVYAAQMMRDYPEAIAKEIEFAIPPFAQMYIEFPFQKFYEVLLPPEMRSIKQLPLEDQDLDVGYFYDGPRVYVMSRTADVSNHNSHGMLLPLRFRLNQPFTYDEEKALTRHLQVSRLGIDTFLWGSCYPKLVKDGNVELAKTLRQHHGCEVWWGANDVMSEPATMAHLLRTNAGDLRSIVAFLLFLNRTRDVQVIDDIPPAPGWVRAKPRTLVRHNLIHIKLDPGPALQRIFKSRATGGWRREHDVRGHWCHDRNYHANKHDHDLREMHHQFWKCLKCGGCRWWRKEHHRGRKELGQVRTAYEVGK
jgi:hypothetical protein